MEIKNYWCIRIKDKDYWLNYKSAIDEYNANKVTTQNFTNKRQKKKYIKQRQNELANQFEKQLRDLSLSRGQILIKLIHRETGKTAYEIIRELRGGVNAFIWNAAGGAYELDLKTEFDTQDRKSTRLNSSHV